MCHSIVFLQGFKDVNSEAAMRKARAAARRRSEMKDSSMQTLPVDKVDIF